MRYRDIVIVAGAMAACALVACASHSRPPAAAPAPAPFPASLVGSNWVLEDLCGRAVLEAPTSTLSFLEDGKVAGSGSCNRFTGSATIKGDTIAFGPLAATRMACEAPVGDQEAAYFAALESAEKIKLDGPYLVILCKGRDKPMRFARLERR